MLSLIDVISQPQTLRLSSPGKKTRTGNEIECEKLIWLQCFVLSGKWQLTCLFAYTRRHAFDKSSCCNNVYNSSRVTANRSLSVESITIIINWNGAVNRDGCGIYFKTIANIHFVNINNTTTTIIILTILANIFVENGKERKVRPESFYSPQKSIRESELVQW